MRYGGPVLEGKTTNLKRCFLVTGDVCSQLSLRILGIFARVSTIPTVFECYLKQGVLEIYIETGVEDEQSLSLMQQRIQQIIGIRDVLVVKGSDNRGSRSGLQQTSVVDCHSPLAFEAKVA
ncbi:MAG: hypothetical protein COA41_05770 [Sphingopyxis sp.]|mgnify:CR=1 FL=1|jgi:hypothetical protein|nr:MAG: hypothetical protein COA41_05770 [Sphingopyxis sp.]